jgi:hypothetical protein
LQVFEHWCESTAVHELHEDPEAVLIVKGLEALHDRLALTQLHDADLVLYSFAPVGDALAAEHAGESTDALFADNFVVL